jgi:hypothetical protein
MRQLDSFERLRLMQAGVYRVRTRHKLKFNLLPARQRPRAGQAKVTATRLIWYS